MKTLKRFILSLSTLLLISGVGLSATVGAEGGHGSVTGDLPRSSEPEQTTTGSGTSDDASGDTSKLSDQFKKTAEQKIEAELKTAKVHTETEREKSCIARKTSLTNRMANAVTRSQKYKAVFDKIYGNVKDFYASKNLTVTDYSTLTAKVDAAQANAQASIDALKSLDVSVDCTSQTVASSVSAFQQAVKSTRDSLKAYRAKIIDLIKAVHGASSASGDSPTNGSNQ